jgi:Putative zinc-finger
VADNIKFGSPKVLQFGDRTAGNQPGDNGHCAQCESMLADALDGTLSAADQKLFDDHMAHCGPCAQLLADAQRGAAWLEMLRTPAPEPPAALLEMILARTSGMLAVGDAGRIAPAGMQHAGLAGATLGQADPLSGAAALTPDSRDYGVPGAVAPYGNVVPFRRRATAAFRGSSFGQIVLQPRLAMTAAMAFFSIALTMDLTGVRLQDLHASDLRPSILKRHFYSANARVVQYYEGLRVVYELESRVHDLQSASDNDAATGSQIAPQTTTPGASPNAKPGTNQPGSPAPAAQPGQNGPDGQSPAAKPDKKQPASGPASGPATGPAFAPSPKSGTSRREDLERNLRLLATTDADLPLTGLIGAGGASPGVVVATCYVTTVVCNIERVKGSLV